ncbi:MAG: tape measure protein [Candidatus Thiodiazotropha sp. (ex Troendleina suluensis)]|nr:tape measure protein [Candidatus Thiodiazotropha sp. (ex Troendleina suluensis)]
MDQDLELKVTLTGDGRNLSGTINLSRDEFKGLSKEMNRSSDASKKLGRSMEKTNKTIDKTGVALKKAGALAAAYFSAQTVLGAIKAADSWAVLQQRIETATKATGDYVMVSDELYRITRENGAAMEGSVALFQSISRTRKELGTTNKDVLKLTDTIQKLGVIGGLTTQGMQAGMMQFSQMMAGGVARAEEMNSLFENMPEVAARIAHGMDMTQGELRNAVLAGRVLSKDVFESLLKQSDEISAEFEGMPLSIERGWQTLSTSVGHFLGELNEATGIVQGIADLLKNTADEIDQIVSFSNKYRDITREYLNPTGENKLNQLLEERLELESELFFLESSYYGSNTKRLEKLQQELKAVNAEITATQQSIQSALEVKPDQQGGPSNNQAKLAYLEQYKKLLAEGKKLTEEAMTPLEAYDAQVGHLFDLYGLGAINLETLNRLEIQYKETLADATGVTAQLRKEEKERSKLLDGMLDQYIDEEKAVSDAHDVKEEYLRGLHAELELMQYTGRELAIETELRKAHAKGIYDQDKAIRQLSGDLYDARDAAKAMADEADPTAEAWEHAVERIDEAFADAWAGAFDSYKAFADRLKDAFAQLLGELAHQAFTRPILVNMGLQGGQGGAATAGGSSYSSSLLNSGSNYLMNSGTNYLSSLFGSGSAGSATPVLMDTGGGFMVEMPGAGGAGATAGGSFLNTAGGALAAYNVAGNRGGWGGALGGVAAGAGTTALMGGASAALAGGSFGAGAMGAMAGMGPIGWAALAAAALYGAFGNKSDPDARLTTRSNDYVNTGPLSHSWENDVSVESVFGYTGFRERGTKGVRTGDLIPALESAASIDNAIAQAYGEEITQSIREALDGWYDQTWSADGSRIEEMFANRFSVILEELEAAGFDYVDMVKTTGTTFTEWAQNLDVLKTASDAGLEFDSVESAAEAVAQYAQVSVAIAQLTELWMTQEERLQRSRDALDDFNSEIERSGTAYIDTRLELQDYIDGLDLTTQAGRDLATQALAIAGTLDAVVASTGALADDQRLSNSRINLVSALSDEIDSLELQRATLEDAVADAHQQYTDALRSNIDEQQSVLNEARTAAADWSGIAQTLADAQHDIVGSALGRDAQAGVANQRFNNTLQEAWQGNQDAMLSLPGLANDYLGAARRNAGSSQDYLRSVATVRSQLSTAEDLAETQATRNERLAVSAEQQVEMLQLQLDEAEGLHDDVLSLEQAYQKLQKAELELASASFDEQIRQHEALLVSLNGIETGVVSLSDAMAAYLGAGGELPNTPATSNVAVGPGPATPDFGPVPYFANGGISSGPRSGYPVELHGTEAVIPLPDGRAVPVSLTMKGNSNDELVKEIRRLREDLANARAEQRTIGVETIKATKKTAKMLDRWDIDGQPAVRVTA